jgi:galactose oxidase-like protein
MKILHSLGVGLVSATSILARRVAFPVLFLGAGLVLVQPCARASSVFNNTGGLATARFIHTVTLLTNGKVLVAGGLDASNGYLASAELYDPASGTWTATGSLGTARAFHTATLLTNGKVLVAGGVDVSSFPSARGTVRSGERDLDGHRQPRHRTP